MPERPAPTEHQAMILDIRDRELDAEYATKKREALMGIVEKATQKPSEIAPTPEENDEDSVRKILSKILVSLFITKSKDPREVAADKTKLAELGINYDYDRYKTLTSSERPVASDLLDDFLTQWRQKRMQSTGEKNEE